jgi:hypothetical protein
MVQTQSIINENSLTEILPGGSNPDAFELAEAWYPVSSSLPSRFR